MPARGCGWGGLLLLAVLLAGCAAPPPLPPPSSGLVEWRQGKALMPQALAEHTQRVFARLAVVAELEVPLRIDGSEVINAYAHRTDAGGFGIVVNAGLLDMLGFDGDELAFVLAHELAHVQLRHLSDETLEAKRQSADTVEILSMLADIVLPLSGVALSAGHAVREAGYSREQEGDADRLGVALMRSAGFDPRGALRFQHKLLRVSNPSQLNLLRTHPSGEARIAALEALIETQ